MNILQRIRNGWREAVIAATFRRFEEQLRVEHLATAEHAFDSSSLQAELNAFLAPHEARASEVFDQPISSAVLVVQATQARMAALKDELELLSRDLQKELQAQFGRQESLREERRSASNRCHAAAARISAAQDQIDRWHRRSKSAWPIVGNAGRRLPQHSLFGQSFGDLDGHKADRDSAYAELQSAKRQVAAVSDQLGEVDNEIDALKQARRAQIDMFKAGLSVRDHAALIASTAAELGEQRSACVRLQAKRTAMLANARALPEAKHLTAEIDRIARHKSAFISAFDSAEAASNRRAQHRARHEQNGQPS